MYDVACRANLPARILSQHLLQAFLCIPLHAPRTRHVSWPLQGPALHQLLYCLGAKSLLRRSPGRKPTASARGARSGQRAPSHAAQKHAVPGGGRDGVEKRPSGRRTSCFFFLKPLFSGLKKKTYHCQLPVGSVGVLERDGRNRCP